MYLKYIYLDVDSIHEFHVLIKSGYWGTRFRNDYDELLIFQLFDVEQTIEFLKVTQDSSGRMFIPSPLLPFNPDKILSPRRSQRDSFDIYSGNGKGRN